MNTTYTEDGKRVLEFTYREVSDEVNRLGLTYPTDAEFTDEEIDAAIGKLDSYGLSKNVVTFAGPEFTPAQLTAFAKFAEALGKNTAVTHDYNGWVIKRDTTEEERREAALANLKSKRAQEQRDTANLSLKMRFEADNGLTIE
jgi:hypothetical protein